MLITANNLSSLTEEERRIIEIYSQSANHYYGNTPEEQDLLPSIGARLGGYSPSRFLDCCPTLIGLRLLDIGCGCGRFSVRIKPLGIEYTGIDPAEGMIELARKFYPQEDFHLLDVESLPFAFQPATFHVFVAVNSLVFIPGERMTSTLRKLRSVLKEGAVGLIVHSSTRDHSGHLSAIIDDTNEEVEFAEVLWTPESLAPHLSAAGMEIQQAATDGMFWHTTVIAS
jgi:SAM-dependent methyltransferase